MSTTAARDQVEPKQRPRSSTKSKLSTTGVDDTRRSTTSTQPTMNNTTPPQPQSRSHPVSTKPGQLHCTISRPGAGRLESEPTEESGCDEDSRGLPSACR